MSALRERYERLAVLPEPKASGPLVGSGTVALGYVYGAIHPAFLQSVIALGANETPLRAVTCVGGLYVDNNRNSVVRNFLDTDCEWLWWVDTDIEFPPDALARLLEASRDGQRKIVAAAYWQIQPEATITTWLRMGDGHMNAITSIPDTGTLPIGACGMGCTLIHRQVFEDIAEQRKDNPDPWVWFGRDLVSMHGITERAGEDVTFCIRALRAGHTTWGLCDLVVRHYKSQQVQAPRLAVCTAETRIG